MFYTYSFTFNKKPYEVGIIIIPYFTDKENETQRLSSLSNV